LNAHKKKTPIILRLLSVAVLLLLSGCAYFAASPPSPPLARQEIDRIVSAFEEQERAVDTLFSSTALTIDVQGFQSEAMVLIVARRNPSTIKIEITHPWGRPLLHVLVKGPYLDILSFSEKRHYRGRLVSSDLSRLIPVPVSPDILWTLSRAYPVLPHYHRAQSTKGDQISLMDKQNADIQVVDLYPDTYLPRRVWFCQQETYMSFSEFQSSNGILYAKEIGLRSNDSRTRMTLEIRQMTFNSPLPEAIFKQEVPRGFERVQM